MPEPRILFVLEYYHPHIGGVETLFHQLVNALQSSGVTCTVLTQRFSPDLAAKETTENGTTIRRISVPNRYLFTFWAFWAGLKHFRKADIIHTTSYNAGIPAFFGGLIFRKPALITFHEAWGKLWFRLPFMSTLSAYSHYAFEQFLLRLPFKYFIGVSHATSKRLREEGVSAHRIKTIYNGLDYAKFEPVSPTKPDIKPDFQMTYFGRIGLSKGVDQLLPAFEGLLQEFPQAQLQLIVPEQPASMISWLQRQIEERRLTANTTITSSLPEAALKKALRQSDWIIIPSYSEGFCFAAAEAVAMGIPIVHSGQGALTEVVSGYHIQARSHKSHHLLPALRRAATGDWDFRPVRHFPLRESVDAYLALYQEHLSPALTNNNPSA